MPDNAPTKNIVQRALSWLRGDDIGTKSVPFVFDEYNRITQNSFSGPIVPLNRAGYYTGHYDYSIDAGDLIDNTAVMACLLWICRTFPEAPLIVKQLQPDGEEKEVPRHALAQKIRRPNPYYSGMLLWQATLLSFNWNGNAYWRKVRNGAGQVLHLYYEPHWNIRPVRSSGQDFITKYQIWRDREWQDMAIEDVVHFRYGIDPRNDMLGMSPLASALREAYTDNEAGRYAAVMFRNLGTPGIIVTPKSSDDDLSETADQLKASLRALTTGDNRGDPLVYSTPIDMQFPANDPEKMDTRGNRKITEERISALLGVPAIVAGLGAGLDRSTFANMAEAREAAYEGNIIPTQAMMADELDIQLLGDFGNPDRERADWDYSKVRVLQDDENKKATRWAILYNAGIVKRSSALADLGLPYDTEDEVYKGESATMAQDASQSDTVLPTADLPPADIVKMLSGEYVTLTNGHKE